MLAEQLHERKTCSAKNMKDTNQQLPQTATSNSCLNMGSSKNNFLNWLNCFRAVRVIALVSMAVVDGNQ
jgi:hypothetical protein